MRVVGKGSKKIWNEPGVGSGDAAALLGCAADENDNVLVLWARLVAKYCLKEIKKLRKVTELQQGSQDWLDWRKQGVGGSEVGCVLGANPFRDSKADRIWARKLPADHPEARPEVADNPAMSRGRKLEPAAREMYEQLYGWKVEPVCVIHDLYPCARASLDGLRSDDRLVVEIKCSGSKNHQRYLDVGAITDHFERQTAFWQTVPYYAAQVQYQLLLTGAPVCHFVGYSPDFGGTDRLAVFELFPQPKLQEFLLQRVVDFWAFVESKTCPPFDWLEPCWTLPDRDDLKVPEVGDLPTGTTSCGPS